MIQVIPRKKKETWDKEGKTANEQSIHHQVSAVGSWTLIYWGTLEDVEYSSVTQTEKWGCWSMYLPTLIHYWLKSAPGISSLCPREMPGEEGCWCLQLKLSICTGMTERMWTGHQQCSPKFINISWMNKCRALWVPKHVGFKSFKTKCRSFHSTASTFIVYFWKS